MMAGLRALAVLAAAAGPASLTGVLLKPGEETGFVPSGPVRTFATAAAWAGTFPPSARGAVSRDLRAAGFRVAAYQLQAGPGGAQGTSAAVRLSSPARARRLLRAVVALDERGQSGASVTRFTVPGIAGSLGFDSSTAAGAAVSSVQWVQGECVLEVQAYRPGGSTALQPPVTAGARAVHRRSRGRC